MERKIMRKTRTAVMVAALTLIGTASLIAPYSKSQTPSGRKQGGAAPPAGWQADPEWVETRYGGWGGPGVSAAPGPMDSMLLKDYAPKTSVVVPATSVPKAKYPA